MLRAQATGFHRQQRTVRSWKAWATEHGVEVLTEKAFAKALQDRGWTYKRTNIARGFKDLVLKAGAKEGRREGRN